jgi:ABC-2 type transport system permease protein
MPGIATLTGARLRRLARDRRVLPGLLVLPSLLGLALALLLPLGPEAFRVRLVIAIGDRDEAAMAVLRGPIRDIYRTGAVDIAPVDLPEQVEASVAGGWSDVGLVIPPGFSERVHVGGTAELQVVVHPDARRQGEIVRQALDAFAAGLASIRLAVRAVEALDGTPVPAPELADAAAALPPPILIEPVAVPDRQAPPAAALMAGGSGLLALVVAWAGVAHLPAERRSGILRRTLAAPVMRTAPPLAGLIASILLALAALGLAWLVSLLVLGASWGDPLGVALLVGACAIAAGGGALLISAFVQDARSGAIAAVATSLVGALAGGVFYPAARAPGMLADLASLSPHGWLLAGLDALAGGGSAEAAGGPILGLLALGLAAAVSGVVVAVRRGGATWPS